MYVCVCNAVTENQIQQAIAEGAQSVAQLREQLNVTGVCGMCIESVIDCLQTAVLPAQAPDYLQAAVSPAAGKAALP